MAMTLNSPAFKQSGHIPSKYTCEGEDVSPPLAWEGVPCGAKSLIIDDPDAPDPKAPKMVWVHWVVYNIPPDTTSLPENAGKTRLPQDALPVSADRPAPLFPQALCAGYHARSESRDEISDRTRDAGPRASQCRTDRHVSKG
jgi:Phosphatidylethanolamine-binding protein